jgi:ATP-dependent DNA helicase RecG
VRGDLFTQARVTLDLLVTKYLRAAISYSGLQRIESLPVPEEALREALLNALIHKDYASHSPIQIRVYPDKLQIWNSAVLPEGWTAEKLLADHSSHPFNPLVAAAFFRAGEIEAWGRGIQRIVEACEAAGAPSPVIRYDISDYWFEFPFAKGYVEAVFGGRTTRDTTQETTQEITQETAPATTQERILAALRAEPALTRRALAARFGLTPDGVKYHLAKLTAARRLRHVGPTKAGKWEILG